MLVVTVSVVLIVPAGRIWLDEGAVMVMVGAMKL